MIRAIVTALVLSALAAPASAESEEGPPLQRANVDLSDRSSLQHGAKLFINYCVSCHSASFMRYNRIAADLGIPGDKMKQNLMFASNKIGDTMTVAMRSEDAEAWLGVPPPDLSVVARSRGEDWLYSFLQGFYLDDKRPTGVNNLYFPSTAMPHVLWELQGLKKPVYHAVPDEMTGKDTQVIEHLEQVTPGTLSAAEYKHAIRDLVGFLVYLGEPAKLLRYRIGVGVIMFLSVLLIVVYLMKREYWKDVH